MTSLSSKASAQVGHLAAAVLLGFPILYLLQQATLHLLGGESSVQGGKLLALLLNTLAISGLISFLAMALGFALAFLVAKTDLPGKKFWQVAFVLPLSIPSYVAAIAYTSLLAPKGALYQWSGVELWNIYGADGVIFILTLSTFPYSFLICRSQLKKMSGTWEDMAHDLGHSKLTTLFTVIIPLCRPALLSSVLLTALYVLTDFGAIALLRYNTFTTAIFYQLDSFDRESAALLGLVLLLLVLGIVHGRDALLGKTRYQSLDARNAKPVSHSLGPYKGVALFFVAMVAICSVGVPLVTLLCHLLSSPDIPWSRLWHPLLHSLWPAAGVAAMATLAGSLSNYSLAVSSGGGAKVFQKVTASLYGIPNILIALSTLFVARTFFGPLYGTVVPLLLGLFMQFFPQALEAMTWGRKALGKNLLRASFDLGQGHWQTMKTVFFPLLKGSAGAAFLLVFVSVLKELPIQLILRPPGVQTLSVQLWVDANEAFYPQAALYGLTIVALAATATPFILRRY